jgi:hypothetical protein
MVPGQFGSRSSGEAAFRYHPGDTADTEDDPGQIQPVQAFAEKEPSHDGRHYRRRGPHERGQTRTDHDQRFEPQTVTYHQTDQTGDSQPDDLFSGNILGPDVPVTEPESNRVDSHGKDQPDVVDAEGADAFTGLSEEDGCKRPENGGGDSRYVTDVGFDCYPLLDDGFKARKLNPGTGRFQYKDVGLRDCLSAMFPDGLPGSAGFFKRLVYRSHSNCAKSSSSLTELTARPRLTVLVSLSEIAPVAGSLSASAAVTIPITLGTGFSICE